MRGHLRLPTGQLTIVSRKKASDQSLSADDVRRKIPANADCEIAKANVAAIEVRSPFDCLSFGTVTIRLPWRIDATPSGFLTTPNRPHPVGKTAREGCK
jgi:hypothetical protein